MLLTYAQVVSRYEDMSPANYLELERQNDGDVIIRCHIQGTDDELFPRCSTQLEFCTWVGGGRSPHTLKALIDLIEAIKLDNKERPQER